MNFSRLRMVKTTSNCSCFGLYSLRFLEKTGALNGTLVKFSHHDFCSLAVLLYFSAFKIKFSSMLNSFITSCSSFGLSSLSFLEKTTALNRTLVKFSQPEFCSLAVLSYFSAFKIKFSLCVIPSSLPRMVLLPQ